MCAFVIPRAGRLSSCQHQVVLVSGHAVRPWQSQRAALAELPKTAESAVTREVEQGSSAAGLETPSQTVWTVTILLILLHTLV